MMMVMLITTITDYSIISPSFLVSD
ncbi:hypothetical protein QR98_0079300, partial [Sarcoptes scabiei]